MNPQLKNGAWGKNKLVKDQYELQDNQGQRNASRNTGSEAPDLSEQPKVWHITFSKADREPH